MYFAITCSEDGDIEIKEYNHDDLTKFINDEKEGDFDTVDFMKTITDKNPQYWGPNSILIIKGEIMVPKPVKIIEQYRIE